MLTYTTIGNLPIYMLGYVPGAQHTTVLPTIAMSQWSEAASEEPDKWAGISQALSLATARAIASLASKSLAGCPREATAVIGVQITHLYAEGCVFVTASGTYVQHS